MVGIDLGVGSSPLMVFVQDAFQERNLFVKLDKTMTLIHALDDDLKKRVKANEFQKQIKIFEDNGEFMREFELVSSMKDNIESSLEYFGNNYLNTTDFEYRGELEQQVRNIKQMLRIFLGNLIKELTKRGSLEI